MAADFISTPQPRLAQSDITANVLVTNGTKRVSLTLKREFSSDEEKMTLVLTPEEAQLIADALIRKAVNVSRGVHDNDREAI